MCTCPRGGVGGKGNLTQYMILILLVDGAVLLGMTVHGWRRGFVCLISEAVSLFASVWAAVLLSGIAAGWQGGDTSDIWSGLLFLVILGILYKVLHRILSSIRFIARLPIFSWLDAILGVVTGFAEGFAILYALEYFLRMYLLR